MVSDLDFNGNAKRKILRVRLNLTAAIGLMTGDVFPPAKWK